MSTAPLRIPSDASRPSTEAVSESDQEPRQQACREAPDTHASPTVQDLPPNSARISLRSLWRRQHASTPQREPRSNSISMVSDLQTGLTSAALLKMRLERDENNAPRIPVLLQYLRVQVTDTFNSHSSGHHVYRIELSYGYGMVSWVIYREVRDFFNLHAYYRTHSVANTLYKSFSSEADSEGDLPSFPKGSFTNRFTRQRQQQDGKTAQEHQDAQERTYRQALTDYLQKLIKFAMFRSEANRLCRFLEISAMGLQVASLDGYLGKQGYLQIKSKSSWRDTQSLVQRPKRRIPKWFIVRESYIIIVEEAHSLRLYDVFLMDQEFKVVQKHTLRPASLKHAPKNEVEEDKEGKLAWPETHHTSTGTIGDYVRRHRFNLYNAERKLKLTAKNERELEQFLLSIQWAAHHNPFGKQTRFGSFAPIRRCAAVQWLVDGRDYYWNLSEALLHARDCIYIHDWWLSPEMYLRRPGTPEWRLDHLLQKKASEGVLVYVILYNEVSNQFTPTDSAYAKSRLMELHPNIVVQRSPSHLKTGTFYWAHHEKLCVVDQMVAFMGGFDLCFGRYDTPSHPLVDDAAMGPSTTTDPSLLGPALDGAEAHIWPGQDYANERKVEWQILTKPEMDLLPRDKVPRMPWHDVGVQILGQPARDLCRHFCQRWNMLLRSKKHTRRMDFLLPPSDLTEDEIRRFGVQGTCDVQICRSGGPWSLSTPKTVEHSIQNAYLKAIEQSEHFVYVENQFFVTSTVMESTEIENSIGLALVERIVRAHRERTPWRAIILIPATPGFPMEYDHPESGSVRIISALQYLSIARGPHSIFARLASVGIDPHAYIGFYSLRQWGRMRHGQLVTEQVYPHDKVMIVDDRLAIIGSANINERSQRGDRDSELACVVQDHDMLMSRMAGEAFQVGRFPHTLRMRLMHEHVGWDVDAMERGENVQITQDPQPQVVPKCLLDPVAQYDVWKAVATHNTVIYRQVFRCVPDDEIKAWASYKVAMQHHDRVGRSVTDGSAPNGTDLFPPEQVENMAAQLQRCCGTLIQHPTEFLEHDATRGNYLFAKDHINPLIVFD